MSTEPRSEPPELPNFSYRSWLGGGGFADVFLYDQFRPARQVAVKVLRSAALDHEARRAFDDEADLMARVSAHPYIVTIYDAGVAPDGRPFLVMEYYPRSHMGERARSSGLSVPEVLKVGIQVASAVEAAHRAGILHRDIKPANVLVSQYNRPGLTDFGIAGERAGGTLTAFQGTTEAYVPPEVLLDTSPGDERGDVYSLAATLYALLTTHAPFEDPGNRDTQAMLERTISSPVPPIGRDDVPRSLELLLSQAMAKNPAHRPRSAESFARAMQGIERELALEPTEFALADSMASAPPPPVRDQEDGTKAGPIQAFSPIPPLAPGSPDDLDASGTATTVEGGEGAGDPEVQATVLDEIDQSPISERVVTGRKKFLVAGGVALLAVGALVVAMAGGGDKPGANATAVSTTAEPQPTSTTAAGHRDEWVISGESTGGSSQQLILIFGPPIRAKEYDSRLKSCSYDPGRDATVKVSFDVTNTSTGSPEDLGFNLRLDGPPQGSLGLASDTRYELGPVCTEVSTSVDNTIFGVFYPRQVPPGSNITGTFIVLLRNYFDEDHSHGNAAAYRDLRLVPELLFGPREAPRWVKDVEIVHSSLAAEPGPQIVAVKEPST